MYHPATELPMILVAKYRETINSDDVEIANAVEAVIIDAIMFTHECGAPSAHRILAAMLDEGDE